jgi:hypothetical protein
MSRIDPAAAVEVKKPTEAVATDLTGTPRTYNANHAAQPGPSGPAPPLSAADHEAIRAHYRQSLEITERKLYERYGRPDPLGVTDDQA